MQLLRAGVSQEDLAKMLSAMGHEVTAQSVRSKLARGTFSHTCGARIGSVLPCCRGMPRQRTLDEG
jgi:hypothetical protein